LRHDASGVHVYVGKVKTGALSPTFIWLAIKSVLITKGKFSVCKNSQRLIESEG
jgi:hypothetical protein